MAVANLSGSPASRTRRIVSSRRALAAALCVAEAPDTIRGSSMPGRGLTSKAASALAHTRSRLSADLPNTAWSLRDRPSRTVCSVLVAPPVPRASSANVAVTTTRCAGAAARLAGHTPAEVGSRPHLLDLASLTPVHKVQVCQRRTPPLG